MKNLILFSASAGISLSAVSAIQCDAVGGPSLSQQTGPQPCQLPFRFVGEVLKNNNPVYIDKRFTACPSTTEFPPYYNTTLGPPAAPDGTVGWCSTQSFYQPALESVQLEWGYCNCTTETPTATPTAQPTYSPTVSPSQSPSAHPTSSPLKSPTHSPSKSPLQPSSSPTVSPNHPTISPTVSPTKAPLEAGSPTTSPTVQTAMPTVAPSESPTITAPTIQPNSLPTFDNSSKPTSSPTIDDTLLPRPTTSPSSSPVEATLVTVELAFGALFESIVPASVLEQLEQLENLALSSLLVDLLLERILSQVYDSISEIGNQGDSANQLLKLASRVRLGYTTAESHSSSVSDPSKSLWAYDLNVSGERDVSEHRRMQSGNAVMQRNRENSFDVTDITLIDNIAKDFVAIRLPRRGLSVSESLLDEFCSSSSSYGAKPGYVALLSVLEHFAAGMELVNSTTVDSDIATSQSDNHVANVTSLLNEIEAKTRKPSTYYTERAANTTIEFPDGAWVTLHIATVVVVNLREATLPSSTLLVRSSARHAVENPMGYNEESLKDKLLQFVLLLEENTGTESCFQDPLEEKVIRVISESIPIGTVTHPKCEHVLSKNLLTSTNGEVLANQCVEQFKSAARGSNQESSWKRTELPLLCSCRRLLLDVVLNFNVLCRYRAVSLLEQAQKLRCSWAE